MGPLLRDREIDVYVGEKFLKTIKRHVRQNEQFYPSRGVIEVQKREWVKVRAASQAPYPRWRLAVEENEWLDREATFKK